MSIQMIVAILVTALLLLLILRGNRNKVLLLVLVFIVVVSWLSLGVSAVSKNLQEGSQGVDFRLPNLKFLALALLISIILLLVSTFLGRQCRRTTVVFLGAVWLAGGMGWLAGEWSGILAITMPSLLILVVGLLALPPFVLPVAPLPWKRPAFVALVYFFGWLVGVWAGWIEMGAIPFWVFLQGLLLILRFSLPMGQVRGVVPFFLFVLYGLMAVLVWRGLRAFELEPFNLLVLTQGLLALSAYALPVVGDVTTWRLGLPLKSSTITWSMVFTGLFGWGLLAAMIGGRIEASVTNFLILFLGVAAFTRFVLPNDDDVGGGSSISTVTALVLLVLYALVWVSGIMTEDLEFDFFGLVTFITGALTIFVPVLVRSAGNWEGLRAILTYSLGRNYPYKAMVGHKLVTRSEGVLPFQQFLAGPGIILTDAAHATVVYQGGDFNRVSPPGLTMTQTFQYDKEVVDLRVQLRVTEVNATTRDGIQIEVPVFTPMRIATGGQKVERDRPFPYDPDALRKAVHAARIDQDKEKRWPWDSLVQHAVEQFMRDIIARYAVDDLRRADLRQAIINELRETLNEFIAREDLGLELIGCGIGDLKPEPGVVRQRIENWKAHWENLATDYTSAAEAEEIRRVEYARAQAQRDWIVEIAAGLTGMDDLRDYQQTQVIMMNLLEAIERAAEAESPDTQLQARSITQTLRLGLAPDDMFGTVGGEQ